MRSLSESYDPRYGPAFGRLSREEICQVVKKGGRPKDGFPPKKKEQPAPPVPTTTPASVPTPQEQPQQQQQQQQQDGVMDSAGADAGAAKPDSKKETAAKPMNWAGLFRSANAAPSPAPSQPNGSAADKAANLNKASGVNGLKFDGIADVLHKYKPTYASPLTQPRGLVNNGNMCFMNAILQPLLHCPPFYNLLIQIGKHVVHDFKNPTPLVDSLIEFMREFLVVEKDQANYGAPFVPENVYDALRGLKKFDSMRGRQEDCQEFLGYLLDGLHEEFLAAMKEKPLGSDANGTLDHDDSESGVSEDEWMEVTGPKNKASFTRTAQFAETPISNIFSGKLRSILRIPSQKDSVTLEPFQSLQLDLTPDNVLTIEDALSNSTLPEVLDGYTGEKGGMPVEATKKTFIEHAPPVLVLHLKRFIYKDGGTQKLHKDVGYKAMLHLDPRFISPTRRPSSAIPYKLFGVVYHHGRTAAGGHYTCDVLRQNDEWLHIDDTNITVISEADVTTPTDGTGHGPKPTMNGPLTNGCVSEAAALAAALSASTLPAGRSSDAVAYVLFYIRTDQRATPTPSPPHSGSSVGSPIPKSSLPNGASHAKASPVATTTARKH
ncbi:MAG: hypothetical protein J3Q66DRAFT_72707 [Benniella sp.]|nr:MAG: hypothetical protein J3Q66DRAFT_72707 [Benniella sp.]